MTKVNQLYAETPVRNPSGRKPVGHAVLVEPCDENLKTTLIKIPDAVRARYQTIENEVRVIEVGSEAWVEERVPRALPGQKVMITAFAGAMVMGKDGRQYRMINDRDIFCVIEE